MALQMIPSTGAVGFPVQILGLCCGQIVVVPGSVASIEGEQGDELLLLLRGDAFSVISTAQYEKIPRATSFRLGIYKIFKEFSRYASALPIVDYLTDQRAVH